MYFGGTSEPAREVAAEHADCYLMWIETVASTRDLVADLRDQFTNGIALLDQLAGGDFTAVSRPRQDLVVCHAQIAPFVSVLFDHIVEAIYAPPENIRCDAVDHYHETG